MTPEGLKLETHARKIMREIEEMNNAMLHKKRTIRIGSSVTVGHYLLNNYLSLLKTSLPMIDFKVIISNTAEMEELLLENRIDLAIVEGYIHSKRLTQIPLQEDELITVIGPEYAFKKKPTHLSDLAHLPWISREKGSQNRNQFEHALMQQKIYPQVVFSATNIETILQAVKNNLGFAIVSTLAAEQAIHNQTLRKIELEDYHCPRSIRAVYQTKKQEDSILLHILKCLQSEVETNANNPCP